MFIFTYQLKSLFATFHFFLHLRPSFWAVFLFSILFKIPSVKIYYRWNLQFLLIWKCHHLIFLPKNWVCWYTVLEWWSVSLRTLKTFLQSLLASIVMAKNSGDGLSIAILKVLCPFPLGAFRSSLSLMICGFLSVCLSMDFFLLILLIYVVLIMSED